MTNGKLAKISWLDVLWLLFLAGLAILPPVFEVHKQLTLLAIGIVQIFEGRLIAHSPRRGPILVVLLKIALATLLIDHTSELSINSSYYPIYYLPVVTASMYFGTWATLGWTLLTSAAYCSYLYPALQQYELTSESVEILTMRILFFFLAGMVVNRFTLENRKKTEQLAETNRQLERAHADARRSERLAALGQLSAGLAHEIRNPLSVIKGSAEMLNQRLHDSNPLASELAGYISTEVNRLSALVTRFLNFARPLNPERVPQDITALLDHSVKLVADQWQGGTVGVERAYASNLPRVPLDAGLTEQAFVNLVQNAYEAMGSQGGVLTLRVSETERNGRYGVEVRLQDTGPGIPAEQREQVFNPFVTTKKTGVGLGLAIVSKIVDGHHGSIRLESPQGQGASFVVFFPVDEHPASAKPASVSG